MALTIKHTKVSAIPDEADASLIRPSDWNADHSLVGVTDIAQGGTGLSTIGANGTVLQSNGTTASWGTPISGPATNLNGGSTGTVPYQSAPNTTAFTAAGSSGQVLSANAGAIPTWINQSAMTVGNATLASDVAGGSANAILFQNGPSSTHYITPPTVGGKVLGWNGADFNWVDSGGGGAVTSIIAGTNVTISPTTGIGDVTINATGGGSTLDGITQNLTPFETSLGFEAGLVNTGVNNTYLGFQAGRAMTGAVSNVVIGYQAMDVATIPASNVVIGASACGATNNTSNNVVIGHLAMGTATSNGGSNVLVGYQAGSTCTGASNVLIGYQAGNSATTMQNAVGVGSGVFANTTSTAISPTAVGNNALGSLTTGSGAVAVGGLAGAVLTTGDFNTLIGYEAGRSLTTGQGNTAVGFNAGRLATGSLNTLIGHFAGDAITTGTNNTTIGWNSGGALTTGGNNNLLGTSAGVSITTGSGNTIVGGYAGNAALTNQTILSNSAGTIRQQFNENGAMSFDGTTYGSAGNVLQSNGTTSQPIWVSPNIKAVAQFAVNVNMLPGIAVYFINCTDGNITATLPSAAAYVGLQITVKRVDSVGANTLTVASLGGQIEGLTTQTLGPGVSSIYCSDGTNWWELANG